MYGGAVGEARGTHVANVLTQNGATIGPRCTDAVQRIEGAAPHPRPSL